MTSDSFAPATKTLPLVLLGLGLIVLTRAVVLGTPSLFDPSEARFAGSALHMLSSGDWITPKIHRFSEEWIPYWAKPPLHMWLVASSIALLGPSEVTVRIPSFLCTLLVTLSGALFALRFWGRREAVITAAIHLSMVAVFSFSPFALTDALLSATLCLSYLCFAITLSASRWKGIAGYAVFLLLGLGVLTKGPVALALPLVALSLWLGMTKRFEVLKQLPWMGGIALFFLITLPWFLLAERATPGFLSYYFLEENIGRYLEDDFQPNYGTAHRQPYGTIWILLLACSFPWGFLPLLQLRRRGSWRELLSADPMLLFVVSWAVAPALFFTFARQILPSYTYSALPGLALVVTHLITSDWKRHEVVLQRGTEVGIFIANLLAIFVALLESVPLGLFLIFLVVLARAFSSSTSPALKIVALGILFAAIQGALISGSARIIDERKSTYPILRLINDIPSRRPYRPVAILYSDPPSALFYTDKLGIFPRLRLFSGKSFEYAVTHTIRHLVIREQDLSKLPPGALQRLKLQEQIGRWQYLHLVE